MNDDEATLKKTESCVKYFDAAWWCFTPKHQMESYYINGAVDTCDETVRDLFHCLRGKMKAYKQDRPTRVIPSIWEQRSVDEAREFWRKDFKDIFEDETP